MINSQSPFRKQIFGKSNQKSTPKQISDLLGFCQICFISLFFYKYFLRDCKYYNLKRYKYINTGIGQHPNSAIGRPDYWIRPWASCVERQAMNRRILLVGFVIIWNIINFHVFRHLPDISTRYWRKYKMKDNPNKFILLRSWYHNQTKQINWI